MLIAYADFGLLPKIASQICDNIMDSFMSEKCYKGTFLQRNNRNMTIVWSLSYNSFVKTT